jgi:hypothetical protein
MKLGRITLALVATALLVPASANARATIYVDDDSTAGGTCLSPSTSPANPARACPTILAGLTVARNEPQNPGGDDVIVADGTYQGPVLFNSSADDGTVLDGGGVPIPALNEGTTIEWDDASSSSGAVFIGASIEDVTVRDLEVESVDPGNSPTGVIMNAPRSQLVNVHVDMQDDVGQQAGIAVQSNSSDVLLDNVHVDGDWDGQAIRTNGPSLTVEDSTLDVSGDNSTSLALLIEGGNTVVRRSRLTTAPDKFSNPLVEVGPAFLATSASLIAESSLITGGRTGVAARANEAGESASATLRHVTVDVGARGVQDIDLDHTSVEAEKTGAGASTATMNVESSILLDRPDVFGTGASLSCRDTDQLAGSPCAGTGNTTTAPAALFVNAPGGNWQLRGDAPAVDRGGDPALGESTTDELGLPRSVDGNFDCVARTDQGAYEVQGQANSAPDVAITGPAAAFAGVPVALSATASDPQGDPATLAWAFSDGGTATGPSVSHAFPLGAQQATVTASDSHGCAAVATHALSLSAAPPEGDRTRPAISGAGAFPAMFAPKGPARRLRSGARRRVARGTTFRWTLSEPARTTIVIERARPGRRVGGRCVRPTRANRGRRACTRWVRVTTLTAAAAKQGRNARAFSGRVRNRALPAGRYRARFNARDAAGNIAHQRIATLRIVRP